MVGIFLFDLILENRIQGDGQYCLATIFIYMMNMYDILREDEENQDNQEPTKNNIEERLDYEDMLTTIEKDRSSKFSKFKTSDGTDVHIIGSTTYRERGHLRFLTEISLEEGKQINNEVFLEIFKHVYDGCIEYGLHKFSDEAMGDSKFSLASIEVKSGKPFSSGEVSLHLREILPTGVYESITFEFPIVDLFGSSAFKESLSLTDLAGRKDTTPSYDNLNSRAQASVQRSLLIPNNVLPKFPENFEEQRQKLVKRGKAIYLALSKGTYNDKTYVLSPIRFIHLYSVDRHEEYHDEAIDKQTNTIRPNFDIACFGDIATYDGKSAYELSSNNWDEYYKLKQHIQKQFKKYGVSFV
jgi:hypothetical protein